MNKEQLISYWRETSDSDFKTMEHLFEKKDYHWALFMGHLVIEKLLKAVYVRKFDKAPAFIHDLLRLAEKAKLTLTDEQKDQFDTITTFNIRARYDDYKRNFMELCTKEFTTEWIDKIKDLRVWIKKLS